MRSGNNVDGSGNVAVGDEAGTGLGASVNNCIAIGAPGAGPFATFDNTCFIGSIFGEPVSDPGTQTAVFVDQFNVVGIFNSSQRYKHDIQPMDKASETIYSLKPVTFKFNSDWKGTTQYGLIAEEVDKVDPKLVTHGKNGETVSRPLRADQLDVTQRVPQRAQKNRGTTSDYRRVKVNSRPAAKGNGGSHGPDQRAGSANPKSKRAGRSR